MESSGRKLRTVLVTGQSSQWHNWAVSSAELRLLLEGSGRFDVTVAVTPPPGGDMSAFQPSWQDFDLAVIDYEGDDWSEPTRRGFETFVANGGGASIFHASDNAFPSWMAYNEMIAVGGWGGRDETAGPKLRWRDGSAVTDESPGVAMHPKPYRFALETRSPEHPIMRGLPPRWLHATDELYSQLRGPARNVEILATARADPAEVEGGTGEHEPLLMAISYGRGRIFHDALGHVAPDAKSPPDSLRCIGFRETFLRGCEWAATGEVTLPVAEDFPGADRVALASEREA